MCTDVVVETQIDRSSLISALSDPTRWRILELLATTELCTTHLQDELDVKQPLMSHHLKVLRDAGLVTTEPCGRYTYYRLRPGSLDVLSAAVGALAGASHGAPARRPC